MILAAGRGERMRPLTDRTPKPLLRAGGKALIVWHIERLAEAGTTDLVINHAHLGSQIEDTLGDGSRFGVSIRYSPEHPAALETAGGIAHALHLLGKEPFAVINGDIWCDYDFAQLPRHAAALAASNDLAHLVLANNPPHHPQGDFKLSDGRVINYAVLNPHATVLTFSGIGIYRPELFASLDRNSAAPLAPLLREQIALGRVSGEHHRGRWLDIGTPQRLQVLDNELRTSQNVGHV
jgi:N-acetyl-alpha-D-muramate 1-phosphate uridylyltransferase